MQRVGAEGVNQLVHQRKDYTVDFRVERVPFAAIDAFVVRESAGRQIELGIDLQQREGLRLPRLVAERLELRDQPYALRAAGRGKLTRAVFGDRRAAVTKLRVRLVVEVVVDFEDQHVDAHRREPRQVTAQRLKVRIARI